jgi:hypothetical protein
VASYQFDNIDELKRNRDIERDGTWLGLPNGTSLKVRAATDANTAWRAQSNKIANELRRLQNARDNDGARDYIAGKYAELLVADWKGVTANGEPIPFSVEACKAYLLAADDAYAAIDAIIYDTKNFRGQRIEAVRDEAGN